MEASIEDLSVSGYVAELYDGIQGEGLFAGYHHAFIRLAGCNLQCQYCDTKFALDTSVPFKVYRAGMTLVKELSNPVQVATIVSELKFLLDMSDSISGICITGGEPLCQPVFLRNLMKSLKVFGISLHLETNGTLPESLDQVIDVLDITAMDIKLPSTSGRDDLWEKSEAFLKKARTKFVFVKMAVDELTTPEEVKRAAKIVQSTGLGVPIFLQPVTDEAGVATISFRHIMELLEVCNHHVKDVRVMPQLHKIIGSR